jgi:hypothetical protein
MRIDNDLSRYSIISVIVGFISLFLWLIPIISIFTAIVALYTGYKGVDSEQSELSKVGIVFGGISFILTLIRSGFVNGVF